jgi:hypothetical protein
MAAYVFTGTITVSDVRSKQDAINALQIALDDYDDMNPDAATIVIHWDDVKRVKSR